MVVVSGVAVVVVVLLLVVTVMWSFAANLYLATYGQKVVSSQYTFTKKSTGNQHLLKDKLL